MAKEIIYNRGHTFSDFSLLTDFSDERCVGRNVSLESTVAGVNLRLPLMSAAMMSVTGLEMVIALGREGGLPVIPTSVEDGQMAGWINKARSQEMRFVDKPDSVEDDATIEEVLMLRKTHGHTRIPVCDRNNHFMGMFDEDRYYEVGARPSDPVTDAMIPKAEVFSMNDPELDIQKAKDMLGKDQQKYLVVLDSQERLVKMAFEKDMRDTRVAASITTYKGWKDRAILAAEAGADMIVIDTSDAFNEFAGKVVSEYKKTGLEVPICAGNVITREGARYLMDQGADLVKGGMAAGSICTTKREKSVGAPPMFVAEELSNAQREHSREKGKYVPTVIDGGVSSPADITLALTMCDMVMLGGYFNQFHEAAGEKISRDGKETNVETEINAVATWGEGSERAQNMRRYGQTRKTFFAEGVEGTVKYRGRMKPHLKTDMRKVKAAIANAGCTNLEQFRKKARLLHLSPGSQTVIGDAHGVEYK